jgi:hypothetical protein
LRRTAHEADQALRPGHLVGADVVVPPAHLRRLERQPQALLALAQLGGRGFEGRRSLDDALLQLAIETFQLLGLAVELGEDLDLGAQDLRNHRHGDIVDRAVAIAAQEVQVCEEHGRDEDDRRLLEARMLAHHPRQLEAVQVGHEDVDQDDRDVGLQQVRERFLGGIRLQQVLAEVAQYHLVAQQLGRLVVDQENVDLVVRGHDIVSIYRCSHMRNADSSCSVLTGLAR